MGGAFAQMGGLFAGAVQTGEALGRDNLSVVTFGSARPFNAGTASKFDALFPESCYARVYDAADFVPDEWADTHRSGTGIDLSIDGGWSSRLKEIQLDRALSCFLGEDRCSSLDAAAVRYSLAAHSMNNYLAHAPKLRLK